MSTAEERFWRKVRKSDGPGCWEWIASVGKNGYGHFGGSNGKIYDAHRWLFIYRNGPLPAGMVVRHKCNNRLCVNPSHLQLGTHADNHRDMVKAGRAFWQKRAA